jgi:ATP-dependent exoDNAse (exonuclease V) beta subunit
MNTLISASAGTGKTYTLVQKYLSIFETSFKSGRDINFYNVLTITFTEKAANEMKERIREEINRKTDDKNHSEKWTELLNKLNIAPISTIHSFCRRILRESSIIIRRDPYFNILTGLKKAVIQTTITKSYFEKNMSDLTPVINLVGVDESYNLLLNSLNNMYRLKYSFPVTERDVKDKVIGENDIQNIDASICFHKHALKLISIYREYAISQNLIDFDDLLMTTYELLRDRPEITEKFSERFKYILIDEFQDTDILQMKIIEKLYDKKNNELFLVGDPKQSIYKFRGADISIFNATKEKFEYDKEEIKDLNKNWRSNENLVSFQNEFFSRIMPLESSNKIYKATYNVKINSVVDEKFSENTKKVFIINSENKDEEPERLSNLIINMIGEEMIFSNRGNPVKRKIKASDIAVLFRNFNKISKFENVFSTKNIPYFTVGGKNFYDRPEIGGLLSFLNVLTDFSDETSLFKMLMSPLVSLNLDEIMQMKRKNLSLYESFSNSDLPKLSKIKESFDKYSKLKHYLSPGEILQGLIDDNKYIAMLSIYRNSDKLIANVDKLLDIAREMDSYGTSLREITKNIKFFIDNNDEREASLESEKADNIKLMTVHRSKGLEFPIVILADSFFRKKNNDKIQILFQNDKFIISNKELGSNNKDAYINKLRKIEEDKDFEEEKRILYVGCTRAMERLYISISGKANTSSPWFNLMGGVIFLKDEETDTFKVTGAFDSKIKLIEDIKHSRIEKSENPEILYPEINTEFLEPPEDTSYIKYISPTILLQQFEDEYDVIHTDEEPVLKRKPKNMGTLIHSLLQPLGSLHHGKKININQILKDDHSFINDSLSFSENEIQKAKKIIEKIKSNDIINKIESSDLSRSELQIHKKYGKYILMGILDKIIKKDNKWEIIDYKYTFQPEKMRKKHIFQMEFYIYLCKEIFSVEKATLLYVNTGNIFEVYLNDEEDFKKRLNEMINLYQKKVIESLY